MSIVKLEDFYKAVTLELMEMHRLGIKVSPGSWDEVLRLTWDEMSSMSVSEAADLCNSLGWNG